MEVWLFDANRRVYAKNAAGISIGAPIWRGHWYSRKVVGETKRSWVLSCGRKVPKSGGAGVAFTEAEIDRLAFIEDNRLKVTELVRRIDDYDTFVAIAGLVGIKPKEPQQ